MVFETIQAKLLNLFSDKKMAELRFQKKWSQFQWSDVLGKLKEYWYSYRYMDEIQNILQFDENKKILDVGCGVVSILNLLPGIRYGIDPLLEQYRRLYPLDNDIKWVTGCGENMPFDNSSFDIVFCSNVLDHTDNPALAISEINRVLKSKGMLVLTVDMFTETRKRDHAHPYCLGKGDLERLLDNSFNILFDQMSPINAQVYNFMKHNLVQNDYKERIIVAQQC